MVDTDMCRRLTAHFLHHFPLESHAFSFSCAIPEGKRNERPAVGSAGLDGRFQEETSAIHEEESADTQAQVCRLFREFLFILPLFS